MRTEERHPGDSLTNEGMHAAEVRGVGASGHRAGATSVGPVEVDVADGRLARRVRNASTVRRAAMALLAEGIPNPSARLVAERSGVSLRSVFRHFESMDQMIESAVMEFFAELAERCPSPVAGPVDTFEVRLGRFVRAAIDRWSVSAPMMRTVTVLAERSAAVDACIEAARHRAVQDVERMFEPELAAMHAADRRVAIAMAHGASTFETWDNLVRGHGLEPDAVASVVRRFVVAAIAPERCR